MSRTTVRRPTLALAAVGLVAAACTAAPPPLVRDGAGHFSAGARADAQRRLEGVARDHGVWVYIISEPDGDPPRMLDEPIAEAEAAHVPATAILLNQHAVIGAGFSTDVDEAQWGLFDPPLVEELIEAARADDALDALVSYAEDWAAGPREPPEVVPNPPLQAPTTEP